MQAPPQQPRAVAWLPPQDMYIEYHSTSAHACKTRLAASACKSGVCKCSLLLAFDWAQCQADVERQRPRRTM